MRISLRNKLNIIELITIRICFTIYSGWVTAATILNLSIYLKSIGFKDPLVSEEIMSNLVIWLAFLIYNFIAYKEKNPLFSLILNWAFIAIYIKQE